MHAARNVHGVCQWGILSIVDPRCKKALCNRAVFHRVWSWRANIKQTLRRWVALHLSSLSRSLFHFLSSSFLSVPFSFLVPFLHTRWYQNLWTLHAVLRHWLKRTNTSIIVSVWWPEHNPAGCYFKSYNRKFEGMSWFDRYPETLHTHSSIFQLQFLEIHTITLPLTCTSLDLVSPALGSLLPVYSQLLIPCWVENRMFGAQ